jgi:hypothetical protein
MMDGQQNVKKKKKIRQESNSTTVNYICEIIYGIVYRLHLLLTFEVLIYFFGFNELYSTLNIILIFQCTLLVQSNEMTVSIYFMFSVFIGTIYWLS